VCTHRLPCADRKQTQRDRIGDWRQSHKPIRFARTTVSTSAHRPQNNHFYGPLEPKPSIEGVVTHSSKPHLSRTYPCERAATRSFAPSAEFSDAKVLNVVMRSIALDGDRKLGPRRLEMLVTALFVVGPDQHVLDPRLNYWNIRRNECNFRFQGEFKSFWVHVHDR